MWQGGPLLLFEFFYSLEDKKEFLHLCPTKIFIFKIKTKKILKTH
jgi:hypothetical protein